MSDFFMPTSLDSWAGFTDYDSSSTSGLDSSFWDYVLENDISVNNPGESDDLQFEDFLSLMVQQLQSQTIDSAMDSTEMLNQLIQMSNVQMMSSLQTSMESLSMASTLTYASGLVGKTVTVGSYDDDGIMQEIVGTVQGTGTYQGLSVIFVNDEMYALSDIMAVGTLPDIPELGGGDTDTGEAGTDDTSGQTTI